MTGVKGVKRTSCEIFLAGCVEAAKVPPLQGFVGSPNRLWGKGRTDLIGAAFALPGWAFQKQERALKRNSINFLLGCVYTSPTINDLKK
jgi:hypothetical protein